MKTKIIILGAGGVGTAIGAALAEKYYEDTLLIGRSDHVFALNLKGCDITGSVKRNVKTKASEKIDFILENTLLIAAVKITDLEKSLKGIKEYVTDTTSVLLVQNGYGVKDITRRTLFGLLPDENIYQAIITFGAVLNKPGSVEFYQGGIKAESSFGNSEYADIFKNTFLEYKLVNDLEKAVWIKLIINSIVNTLSVIFRAKNNVIAQDRLNDLKNYLLNEGIEVARSEGYEINLTVNDINDFIRSENRTSMLQDYFKKRPNEIDFINGTVIRIGEKNGIQVPVNKLIYTIVKNIELTKITEQEETGL